MNQSKSQDASTGSVLAHSTWAETTGTKLISLGLWEVFFSIIFARTVQHQVIKKTEDVLCIVIETFAVGRLQNIKVIQIKCMKLAFREEFLFLT